MIPLNCHSHYSLLQSFAKPANLVARAANFDYSSIALTDYSLSGSVSFISACKEVGIKPIVGTKLRCEELGGSVSLIAKNQRGWTQLVALNNALARTGRITLIDLASATDCVCTAGDIGSCLYAGLVQKESVYAAPNPSNALTYYLHDDHQRLLENRLLVLKDVFGDRFYAGIQRCNDLPIDKIFANMISSLAAKLRVKPLALTNVYLDRDTELEELQILLACGHKLKMDALKEQIKTDQLGHLYRYFNCEGFALEPKDYYASRYTEEETANADDINSQIEEVNILSNPKIPKFDCPNGMSQKDYLLELCREGWKRVSSKLDVSRRQEYADRIKYELDVITGVGLEGYFLIVQDYVNWARNRMLCGSARGSSAGSLISYFLNITTIDPIVPGLIFERFYNSGRNTPGKVSLPDIDTDFPVGGREQVFNYIRDKYGSPQVSQVFTLSEIQGRSAIREVLRIFNVCPSEYVNVISRALPQKASITDKLEETKEKSIIRWTLNNNPDAIKDWCSLDEQGNMVGEYAQYFAKAISIEGTFKSYGKHASALIVSNDPVQDICPMIKDKSSSELLCAIEYEDLERMGMAKFDILGISNLNKLTAVSDLLKYGHIQNTNIETEADDEN